MLERSAVRVGGQGSRGGPSRSRLAQPNDLSIKLPAAKLVDADTCDENAHKVYLLPLQAAQNTDRL